MLTIGAVRMGSVQLPLSLHPIGSVPISEGIALFEDETGVGSVFVWGQVTWTWDESDSGARRLCAVQLVNSDAADQREVASAFGVNETTVWRWRSEYSSGGIAALLPGTPGPKGPSKLTDEMRDRIIELRSSGLSLSGVAEEAGGLHLHRAPSHSQRHCSRHRTSG